MTVRRPRPSPSTRSSRALAARTAELAWAVPQVVGHRLAGFADASAWKTGRGRKEAVRMVAEKQAAFGESWQAMAAQALRSQRSLAAALVRAATPSPSRRKANAAALALQLEMQRAAVALLGKALAPVHRRAVANAKRLGKPRR
jgi:hypothetical protein